MEIGKILLFRESGRCGRISGEERRDLRNQAVGEVKNVF